MKSRTLVTVGLGVALAVLLSACGSHTANDAGGSSGMSMAGTATGPAADVAFAQLMIPHHQQAIDMADMALAQASSPEVLALAEQIKGAQDPEIQAMQGWLETWGAPMVMEGGDHAGHDMGGMTSSGMMSEEDMSALSAARGTDFDALWLRLMIAHHEGAIVMAQEVLSSTGDPDVTALAKAVIDGQTAEISVMRALLAGDSAAAAGMASDTPSAGAMRDHVHNVALDGDTLLIGTHDGLWMQVPGSEPVRASREAFDVMALARDGERWLASGHPGAGMDAPADLGLRASNDGGVTWQDVSLSGEVDFHRLSTSGATVMGMSAHDGALLRSTDDGVTWTDLGSPPLYDLAVSPTEPAIVLGTTDRGPVRSSDAGATFAAVEGAPLLALLTWSADDLYAVGVDGTVYSSKDSGLTWMAVGAVGGQPSAMAAEGSTLAVLVGDTISYSADGGRTFSPRLAGVGG